MLLFLIRHGQTTGNVARLYYGPQDLPLTDVGRDQARSLQPFLSQYTFDRVYASDLARAVETAQLAIPGCEPIQTPLLREMNEGDLMGLTYEQVKENYSHLPNDSYESVNGESQQQAAARMTEFLKLLEHDPCGHVAAFAHAGIMRCLMRLLLGEKVSVSTLCNPNCNIAVFHWDGQHWSLAAWNPRCDF